MKYADIESGELVTVKISELNLSDEDLVFFTELGLKSDDEIAIEI